MRLTVIIPFHSETLKLIILKLINSKIDLSQYVVTYNSSNT